VVEQLKQAPVMAAQPTGEVVELTQVFQTAPPATLAAEPAPAQVALTELPATASSLPLFALCGLMALAGGLMLRSKVVRVR
jgi:membrane anchored protein